MAGLDAFLKQGLPVRRAGHPAAFEVFREVPRDHGAGALETAVAIDGAEYRLIGSRQDPRLAAPAAAILATSEAQRLTDAELARLGGQSRRAHQRGAALRELAFVQVGKGVQQQIGDHHAEHRVAEKLELLPGTHHARRQCRGMRQRRVEQATVEKRVAEPCFEREIVVRPGRAHG
jgi:hypothetical protein